MSDLASYMGASYVGDKVDGKYHGRGEYTFSSGAKFIGEFWDGQFHGRGRIVFPSGNAYSCTWEHGKEVQGTGKFVFADGLEYDDPWAYLSAEDRRFWSEYTNGIRAGEGVARTNEG